MANPYDLSPGLNALGNMLALREQRLQRQQELASLEADRAFKNRLAIDTAQRELDQHKLTMQQKKLDLDTSRQKVEEHAVDLAQTHGADAATRLLEEHFGKGHRLINTGDGIYQRLEPGQESGGRFIDSRRMGSIGRQYGEAIQGKVSFGVGGGAAPPPAQGRVLDDQAIATIVALREIGAPPAVLMRAAREAQARMGQEDLVRADASLLEQPMRNEGGPDEIPGIVLGAQMAPKTLLSPEQEAIERAISAGLVKTDQHFGNVMDRARLEESIRQHQALEGYRTRPRGGGGMGTKQRTALLAEAHRLKQEAAENRKRAEDELAETQGQDKTRM